MMEAYTGFARVYDELMDGVPYEEWCDEILRTFSDYGIKDGLVLDLGCGSGIMTNMLAAAGYDMIGVDASEEMLEEASRKKAMHPHDILYLCQDMREFELYGTVRAIICICDSINYILREEELLKVFLLVENYLDPAGIFFFDFNTVHKYRDVIGDSTIAENREDVSFIWENYYHEEERINEYDLTLFIREGELYRKEEESHFQRGYEWEEVKALIGRTGLILKTVCDADSDEALTADTERIRVVLQKKRGK